MPCYPHTKFFHHSDRIVVISGPHIQVLDTHGRILHSTTDFAREDQDAVIQSGPVRCAATSHDDRYLATIGDDKRLKIWDLESLRLSSARVLPKKPTCIVFSTSTDILVSDKFGDVFRYPLHPNDTRIQEKRANDLLASHEDSSNGELVLGHASLLTSCLLTPDEKFIITSDRDEHIRVSWYPEGYVIESYCLGHRKFVSAIHIPLASPANLISGGGDPELKVWDWMTGRLQRNIDVFTTAEPFIEVNPSRRRHALSGEHNDDNVASSGGGRKRTGKTKRKDDGRMKLEDVKICTPSGSANNTSNTTARVLVVGRISSFLYEGEHHIIFSAVGATSIFEFVLTEDDAQPDVRHRNFGKPVIDFTISGDGTIWVLLDGGFSQVEGSEDMADQHPYRLVQAVRWSSGQFIDDDRYLALLDSLNTICLIPAPVADLDALDLYTDLLALPKSVEGEPGTSDTQVPDAEQKPMDADPDVPVPDATAADATTTAGGPGLTKRALGRLKHKRALDQLRQETRMTEDTSGSGPDSKKLRADSDEEDV